MKLSDIFKRQKNQQIKEKVLQASVTLYPDKIIVETIDRVKEGFGISSTKITLLPVDSDLSLLGLTVRQHLGMTEADLLVSKDDKKRYADFLKRAGFKSGKEYHKNALFLTLYQKGDTITISPTSNGGYTGKNRGFLAIKDASIKLSTDIDDITLADKIKYGWTKCQCNCI